MRARRHAASLALAVVALCVLSVLSFGCRDDAPKFEQVVSLGGDGKVFASITNTGMAVGPNRVTMIVLDDNDQRVHDADVHVAYYKLDESGKDAELHSETDARFLSTELAFVDDQTKETTPVGEEGVYVSYADFDRAGDWGADITVSRDGEELGSIPFRFMVLEEAQDLVIGDEAPPSVQATVTNTPLDDIDSSSPPRPHMHDVAIADALKTGKPLVVAFATPAFCSSRTCAPVMDTVMDPLYEQYRDRATFIHIEPYVLPDLRSANVETPVGAMREWRLHGEPWVFVVDADGRIAGKFEGIMAADEVETALLRTLEASSLQ